MSTYLKKIYTDKFTLFCSFHFFLYQTFRGGSRISLPKKKTGSEFNWALLIFANDFFFFLEDGPCCQFRTFRFDIPLIDGIFYGTGDLFSALLLQWLDQTGGKLCASLRATIASMQAVLKRTAKWTNSKVFLC